MLFEEIERQFNAVMQTLKMQVVDLKEYIPSALDPDLWEHSLLGRAIVRDKRRYHPYYNFRYLVEVRQLKKDPVTREYAKLSLYQVKKFIAYTEQSLSNDLEHLEMSGTASNENKINTIDNRTIAGDPLKGESLNFCFPKEGKVYIFEHICTERQVNKCKLLQLSYHGDE